MDNRKGVVSEIRPDCDMPTDEHGFTADLIIDPASCIKRMNTGQLYECAINRISEFVRRRCADEIKTDPERAFETLVGWYSKVNKNYGDLIRQLRNTPHTRAQLVREAVDGFPTIHMPPFLDGITPATIKQWCDEYGVKHSKVTFARYNPDGTKTMVTTRKPMWIGSKYMMLLAKIPKATSSGISYVSHKGTPIKPGREAKHASSVSITPVRNGEDENRVALVDVSGTNVVRMSQLMANSPRGADTIINEHLLNPTPTNIDEMPISDEALYDNNAILATLNHQVNTIGIDIRHTLTDHVPPPDMEFSGDVLDGLNVSDLSGSDIDTASSDDTDKPKRKKAAPPTAKITPKTKFILVKTETVPEEEPEKLGDDDDEEETDTDTETNQTMDEDND